MAELIVQFFKYALAGGFATAVDIAVFYLVSWKLIPALLEIDPVVNKLGLTVKPVTEAQRSSRFIINTLIAFMISNMTAYIINALWVFPPSPHSWWIAVLLFYAVSGISVFIGTGLGWFMIKRFHLSTTASYAGKLFASLMFNFVCRKYLIF